MSSLKGQLVKCFTTLLLQYPLIFFVEKMREAFAVQKLLTFFKKKFWHFLYISERNFKEMLTNDVLNFNEMLTNDVVSFEQLGDNFTSLCVCVCVCVFY